MEVQNHLNTIKENESALDEVKANHMELQNQVHQAKGEKEQELATRVESLESEVAENQKSMDQLRDENEKLQQANNEHYDKVGNQNEEIESHHLQIEFNKKFIE